MFSWNDFQAELNRFATYIFFTIVFLAFFFLLNYKMYVYIYCVFLLVGGSMWLILFFFQSDNSFLTSLRNALTIPLFTVIPSGLTLNIVQIIKNKSKKFSNNVIFGKYHIHEGFLGIILLVIAFIFIYLRQLILVNKDSLVYWELLLALTGVFLFLLVYIGSFLIFRDLDDVVHLKFFEKINLPKKPNEEYFSSTFNELSRDSLRFYSSPLRMLYPLGLIICSFTEIAIIHNVDFISRHMFGLDSETIVSWSVVGLFIAGALVGLDWYRLFKSCYPKIYEEVEKIKRNIKTT